MRLLSVSLRGITRFTEPVSIDLAGVGPGLVSLVGKNGEGKSTIVGAVPAALWGKLPDRRASLYGYAHGRNAYIELAFDDDGTEIRVRVLIDSERSQTERYITEDGTPVTDGKAASFDAAIEARFGSLALFLSSVFCSQGKSGNFLQAKPGERKALFGELLGIGRYEQIASICRGREELALRRVEAARAVLVETERQLAGLPEAEANASAATAVVDVARGDLDTARAGVDEAHQALEQARVASRQIDDAVAALHAATRERDAAVASMAEPLQAVTDATDAYERRAKEIADRDPDGVEKRGRDEYSEVVAKLDARKVHGATDRAKADHEAAIAALTSKADTAEAVVAREPEAGELQATLDAIAAARAARDQAKADLDRLAGEYREAKAEADRLQALLDVAQGNRQATLERLARTAELLGRVPCENEGHGWRDAFEGGLTHLSAECPLLADARKAKQEHETILADERDTDPFADRKAEIAAAVAKKDGLAEKGRAARTALETAERTFEDLPAEEFTRAGLDRLRADIAAARVVLQGIVEQRATVDAALEKALADAASAEERDREDRHDANNKLQAVLLRAAELRATSKADLEAAAKERDEKISAAEARRAETRRAFEETSERLRCAAERVDDLRASSTADVPVLEEAERQARVTVDQKQATLDELVRLHAQAQAVVDALRDREADASTQRDAVERETSLAQSWSLLATAFGRDGIQALEIDAAGPEVARLTNDLLEACYGARFSVAFETLREKKSGGYSESFDVRVYDGAEQRLAEDLSGGERVILSEAIGLALAIFNARKSGVRWETLWRDETAGALDPEHAQRYVAMLRRARSLGGFYQVIYVAHQPEVSEAADALIVLEDGRARVVERIEREVA